MRGTKVDFHALEPNRINPYIAADCYLPALRGKRILLVTTTAALLAERAHKETFEAIWHNIRRPWFEPASVSAIAFPSLFDARVRRDFESSAQLFESVCAQLANQEFDIALIGVSALGVPLAAFVKGMGKVGVSIGGHLQILFGVQGKRWREDPHWQGLYSNDAWIDLPQEYKPKDRIGWADGGAYW